MKAPRVAIIGVALESNRQAPPAGENDFASAYIMRGQDILADARAMHPRIMREASAFVRAMDATGPWEPIPRVADGMSSARPDRSRAAPALPRTRSRPA